MDGGGNFRANFGVERDGVSLLAADGSHSLGADITTGYPEFDAVLLKKLGWWDELTDAEKKAAEGKNWKTDLSGGIQRVVMKNHGCHPFGNARARAVVWNFPTRSRSTASRCTRRARTWSPSTDPRRQEGLLALAHALQDRAAAQHREQGLREIPDHPDLRPSGRVRGRWRGNALQPVAGRIAAGELRRDQPEGGIERGIRNGDYCWVKTPTGARIKVRALVTERVGVDTAFIPFHFSGWWQGKDLKPYYPEGAMPIVRGEAVNTATTYGYDSVTMMQETKTTVCQIERFA
jgi:formate dehydrogenase major subunit